MTAVRLPHVSSACLGDSFGPATATFLQASGLVYVEKDASLPPIYWETSPRGADCRTEAGEVIRNCAGGPAILLLEPNAGIRGEDSRATDGRFATPGSLAGGTNRTGS